MHFNPTNPVLAYFSKMLASAILPRIDSAVEASVQKFAQPEMLMPNADSRRYGWTHYGIFFPKLPQPHGYSHVMTLLGATGTVMFDNDYLIKTNPRDTATLFTSTAAENAYLYRAYSMANECAIEPNGHLVAFGQELVLRGSYPDYRVTVIYEDFTLDMSIHCTDTVSWFVRNIAYDHLSLLATCEGSITYRGNTVPVEKTMCTFEYARCVSPHQLRKRQLPDTWKLPADFFTYQIINLDEDQQILLTKVSVLGVVGFKGIHIRSLSGAASVYVEDVAFEVIELEPEKRVAPDGRTMWLPTRFRWVANEANETVLDISCAVASPWRFGHGRGYTATYDFTGEVWGRSYTGQGYIEYVNCESEAQKPDRGDEDE